MSLHPATRQHRPESRRRYRRAQLAQALAVLSAALGAQGCASTTVTPIRSEAEDSEARGYRFYEEAPFILVTPDAAGGVTTNVVYLPDLRRKYSVRPCAFLAKNKTTLTATNGVLSEATTIADSATVPVSVVGVAAELAKTVFLGSFDLGSAKSASGTYTIPSPILFEIIRTPRGFEIASIPGTSDTPIRVALPADVDLPQS